MFYVILWALSIPVVVTAFVDSWWRIPAGFWLLHFMIDTLTVAEMGLRASSKGTKFWISWSSVPEAALCTYTLISWSFVIVSDRRVRKIVVCIGAVVVLVRSVFESLRIILVVLNVTILGKRVQDGSISSQPDRDVDDFDIRNVFRPVHHVQSIDDVLTTSFRRAAVGTLRIAQLVLAIIAVITAFDEEVVVMYITNVIVVLEIITCFTSHFRGPIFLKLALGLADLAICLLGPAVLGLRISGDWRTRAWRIASILGIVDSFVVLARSIVQLGYFAFTIVQSAQVAFTEGGGDIRLTEEPEVNLLDAEFGSNVAA